MITNDCPVTDFVEIVGGKWKMVIIFRLSTRPCRFKELSRMVEGVTPRMLSRQLKELERDGLVSRTVESSRPVSVVYALTENAKGLLPLLDLVSKWVREYRLLVQRRDVQSGS